MMMMMTNILMLPQAEGGRHGAGEANAAVFLRR